MKTATDLVEFSLGNSRLRYALNVNEIKRVIPSVRITPVLNAPEIVEGLINFEGTIVPIINLARILELEEKALQLSDHIVLVNTSTRLVGFIVSNINSAQTFGKDQLTEQKNAFPGKNESVAGLILTKEGIIVVYDFKKLLESSGGPEFIEYLREAG